MVRNVLITLIVLFVTAGNCSAMDFDFWALADSDSVIGRLNVSRLLGLTVNESLGWGIEGVWRHDSESPGHIWGVYGTYTHPDTVDVNDILPFEWLPALTGRPYIGASVTVDFENDGDRTVAGPIAGLIIEDILVIEYAYQFVSDDLREYMSDRYRLRIGINPKFLKF